MTLVQQRRELDGLTFIVTALPLAESRKIFFKVQGILQMNSVLAGETDADPTLMAALTTNLKEEDLQACIDAFAPKTVVEDGELTFALKDKMSQDRIFAGKMELVFAWISFCLDVNFGGVIAKMRAVAAKSREARATANEAASSQ